MRSSVSVLAKSVVFLWTLSSLKDWLNNFSFSTVKRNNKTFFHKETNIKSGLNEHCVRLSFWGCAGAMKVWTGATQPTRSWISPEAFLSRWTWRRTASKATRRNAKSCLRESWKFTTEEASSAAPSGWAGAPTHVGTNVVFLLCICVNGVPGAHCGGHGGQAELRSGKRTRLRRDGRPQSPARPRPAGLLQVGQTQHDPDEEPLGGEGVERALERQVKFPPFFYKFSLKTQIFWFAVMSHKHNIVFFIMNSLTGLAEHLIL